MAATSAKVHDLAWRQFYPGFANSWHQGEHVSLIGPTGQGKTTLALELLPIRKHVVALGTKPKDPTLSKLLKNHNYTRIESWNDRKLQERLLLWPRMGHEKDIAKQRREFYTALNAIYREGYWCVYIDEARYLAEMLKLQTMLKLLWTQGRSNKLSIVAGAQRPAFVPPEIFDQSTHLFFWGDNDEINLKRIGGIGYLNSKMIRELVADLDRYQVLYVNSRTGTMCRTKVEIANAPKR